jgi:1,2-phenylacetyl-CoA epoxidase catalytic subunit
MQIALDQLWGHALTMFVEEPAFQPAVRAGLVPEAGGLRERWLSEVSHTLAEAGLSVPETVAPLPESRREHTDDLVRLLDELQSVARSDPMAVW